MLAKQHRFHGYNSLNYTYRHGATVRSPFCAIRYTVGKYDSYRVAIVVSKKVASSAPDRNRIRRRIYEVVGMLAPKYLTNQDIVITVFDNAFINMAHIELVSSIERQLKQISVCSKQNT